MAKGKAQEGESVMGYFKRVFRENRKWLKERSNHEVLQRYRQDNGLGPNDQVPDKVKSGLANAKTLLKRRLRGKQLAAEGGSNPPTSASARKAIRGKAGSLDRLEVQIDECMVEARKLDPQGLDEVIHMLRRARNKVVLIGGEA